MGASKHHFSGNTPTRATHTIQLKVGYTPLRGPRRHSGKYLEAVKDNSNQIEAECSKCSVCGKSATRKFSDDKRFYGRCSKHVSGGQVPYSYKKDSIRRREAK